MPCCPIWKCPRWSSAAVAFIKITDTGRAQIATNRMEKKDKWLELDVSDEIKAAFEEQKTMQDYGIVVATCTDETNVTLNDAKIIAFVSLYRDHHNPEKDINKRISVASALNESEKQLEILFEQQVSAI